MDPEACLQRVASALADGYIPDAIEDLCNYIDWRMNGGFEPDGGDERARGFIGSVHLMLAARLDRARR